MATKGDAPDISNDGSYQLVTRVVKDPDSVEWEFCCVDGQLQYRKRSVRPTMWRMLVSGRKAFALTISVKRLRLWASLLATPLKRKYAR